MASNPKNDPALEALMAQKYRHGFVTDIESDTVPPGLDEDVIRLISRKKAEPEFMLEWRLKSFRHWLTMQEPHWAHLRVAPQKARRYRHIVEHAEALAVVGKGVMRSTREIHRDTVVERGASRCDRASHGAERPLD